MTLHWDIHVPPLNVVVVTGRSRRPVASAATRHDHASSAIATQSPAVEACVEDAVRVVSDLAGRVFLDWTDEGYTRAVERPAGAETTGLARCLETVAASAEWPIGRWTVLVPNHLR